MAFELQIRFPGSSFLPYGQHPDYGAAHEAMLAHFEEAKRAQPGYVTLELSRVPTTVSEVFQVTKTDNTKRYNATGMMNLYRIIERPDEKLSAEELIQLGIVNEDATPKQYKKGAFTRKTNGEKAIEL